jgi:hypothetical protein
VPAVLLCVAIAVLVGVATLVRASAPAARPVVPAAPATARTSEQPAVQPLAVAGWPAAGGLSGVNGDPSIDRRSVEAFCAWRGRPCTVAQVPTARDTWSSMTRGTWFYDSFAGFPGKLVISQGLVPNGRPQDLAACAAGRHDPDWAAFGQIMAANGRADSIVRLGWEFNATYFPWGATDTNTYVQCFRHAATNIRAGNPRVRIEWAINGHRTEPETCGGLSTNCYPGDDVVDIVGIDYYDTEEDARTSEQFAAEAARPEGLTWLLNFAQAHHKKFAVGEWGVAPGSSGNLTGENPQFIKWMHDWFSAHASAIEYETYFNTCEGDDLQSNLWRPAGPDCSRVNHEAGALYESLWGGPS